MSAGPLTPKQLLFLRLHAMDPAPHAWEWQGGDDPKTWRFLAARRNGRPGEAYQATIDKAELADLDARGLLAAGFHVSEAGLDSLRAAGMLP